MTWLLSYEVSGDGRRSEFLKSHQGQEEELDWPLKPEDLCL